MAGDILSKLKEINKTEYAFTDIQAQVFNLLMEGRTVEYISNELQIKKYTINKEIKTVKEIVGLNNEDLKYIRAKRREKENKLDKVELECKRQIGEFIAPRYLGIKDTKEYPNEMYIRISLLRKKYSYKAIYETIKRCQSSLDYAFQNKKFESTNHKLSYIFVVIKNHIDDVYKDIKEKEKQTKIKENEIYNSQLIENMNNVKRAGATKRKDFSDFLNNL